MGVDHAPLDHAEIISRIRVAPAQGDEAVPCPMCGLDARRPLGYEAERRRREFNLLTSLRLQFAASRLEHPSRRRQVFLP